MKVTVKEEVCILLSVCKSKIKLKETLKNDGVKLYLFYVHNKKWYIILCKLLIRTTSITLLFSTNTKEVV